MCVRRLYRLCEVCNHLKAYKALFNRNSFSSFVLLIHGLILSEQVVSCALIARKFVFSKSSQALNYFLNSAKFDLNELSSLRLKISYFLANKKNILNENECFFTLDDFTISKRKYKKTQGVSINYDSCLKKARRSQCLVSSSFLIHGVHCVFKTLFYVGKKFIREDKFATKTELAIRLLSRFGNFIIEKNKDDIGKFIVLLDGGYTNTEVIKSVFNLGFKGFIGRYHKGRNIFTPKKDSINKENDKFLLKNYIENLTINDFHKIKFNGEEKYIYELECGFTGLETGKMVLVIDDVENPALANIRPLITNIKTLSAVEIVFFYSKRWKEETYHQHFKDTFGARTHKIRTLKGLSVFIELIAISYLFCENRRIKKGMESISEVKTELMGIVKQNFILNIRGNHIKKSMQPNVLSKFVA